MCATDGLPGVEEDDMLTKNGQRKHGTTRGLPRPGSFGGTAKASGISRYAVKSRCANEWGGWGRLSVDGSRHYNSDRSEDPWGSVAMATRAVVFHRACCFDSERRFQHRQGEHEGWRQTVGRDTWTSRGKAPSDRPALKPYWGKLAVRNFREGNGNVGIN